jgi:alkanesulfonate monooxygenase SsuD/methylene tetrahydromethanopterin reductase-like flavin-dependent oxidoreductase (luciferase family)
MELGLATFADLAPGVEPERRMRQLLEEAELADQLGLDVFAVGEHHRPDYAEIMAGRGSFIESFPLFGYDLDDYDELFAEKLDLLLKLRESEHVTWSGRLRAPLNDASVWPRPIQDPLPVWVAVGGAPQSVIRAGTLGLPRTLAIIGGQPERFVPLVELYRRALDSAGHDVTQSKLAINTHAFVGESSRQADQAFAASYLAMMNRIGRERGWPPAGRAEYESLRSPRGALAVGSPEQVAEKILFDHQIFGNQRYIAQMSVGAVAHEDVLRSIELFATKVAPIVRAEVARRQPEAEAATHAA